MNKSEVVMGNDDLFEDLVAALVRYAASVGWVVAIGNTADGTEVPGLVMGTEEYVAELLGESVFDPSTLN